MRRHPSTEDVAEIKGLPEVPAIAWHREELSLSYLLIARVLHTAFSWGSREMCVVETD